MKDKERRPNKRYKMKENKKYPYKKNRKDKFTIGERQFEKASMWGFLFGWAIGIFCFLVSVLIVFNEPFIKQNIINEIVIDKSFKIVANSWEDTDMVNSLSYLCSLKETELEKTNCVYKFITDNMVVGYHDEGTNKLNQPEEIFSKPSVCRDTSVLFMSVLNRLNITNDLVQEPGHVYNRVFLKDYTCDVDVVNEGWICEVNKN
jgi:hypothetical protein